MEQFKHWLLCGGLFLAGGVWSRIIPGQDFFEVENIHDLFDIFGALATVVAVIIASFGLGAWRHQARAANDHALATKFLVALRNYHDEVVRSWRYAESSVAQIDAMSWLGDTDKASFIVGVYESRIRDTQASRANVESLAVECAELWGEDINELLAVVYKVDDLIRSFIESYIRLLIRGTLDDETDEDSDITLQRWTAMESKGLATEESAKAYISSKFEPLRLRARSRLIV